MSTGNGILGTNMFAYCENSPVSKSDSNGHVVLSALAATMGKDVLIGIVAAAVSVVSGLIISNIPTVKKSSEKFANTITEAFVRKGHAVQNTLSGLQEKFTVTTIQDTLTDIAGKFGNFKCREAAEAMMISLKRKRRHGVMITIQFPGIKDRNYVWSDIRGMTISENGFHCGIQYEGYVYCNVHPQGLPRIQWINDFVGWGEPMINEIVF